MVWRIDGPQGNESRKIVWEVAPYLRGRGIDVGAGDFKILPHVMSVDNMHHACFGYTVRPDILVQSADDLEILRSESMDFVYSSHLLEHMLDPVAALKEWWRVLKNDGYLILYLPHKNFYPNIGQDGANPDHKHDFLPADVTKMMEELRGWDLLVNQERNEGDEYSFLQIYRKSARKGHFFSCSTKKPDKTCLVCRFGAYGDLMQASSVFRGLKAQGYHVTLMCSPPGVDVVVHDPHIDEFMILDKDQVPNGDLVNFWAWQAKKYDKFVNLSESVEGSLLSMPGRTSHSWPPEVRHKMQEYNYLQFQHELAGIPFDPTHLGVWFYSTPEERTWAQKYRNKIKADFVVMWSLAGSSVHKTWAGLDNIMAAILVTYPTAEILLVGGTECKILEAGWENEKRVHRLSGEWTIRQTLSFLPHVDLLIGPETGVMNAAACMPMPKICFLSHSTWINLTRDWINTVAVWSDKTSCPGRGENVAPACHQLHYGWAHCKKHEESGTSQCMADITPEEVWNEVARIMDPLIKEVA